MKNMKLLTKISIIIVSGIGVFLIFAKVGLFKDFEEPPKPMVKTEKIDYVVRLEGDIVNVYERRGKSETYSQTISEVNIFDLPQQTKEGLKKGMEMEDITQLARFVEEITS